MTIERQALGWPLRAELTSLDNGITVLLTGGCRTHIGCVTAAEPGGAPPHDGFSWASGEGGCGGVGGDTGKAVGPPCLCGMRDPL